MLAETKENAVKYDDQIELYASSKRISLRFIEGQFLIYDCDNKRFACVDQEGNDKCLYIRDAKRRADFENLGCATLKLHRSPKECFEHQKKLILTTKETPFCKASTFQ